MSDVIFTNYNLQIPLLDAIMRVKLGESMKKKIIIIVSFIIFITLLYLLYNLYGIDIQIKLNYNVNIPIADNKIYTYYDEIGRDTNYYHVVKYNTTKLKRIKKLNWTKQIEYDNKDLTKYIEENNLSQIKYDEQLFKYLKEKNIPSKYYPVIDENTLYYKKDFENKFDYLLMIYNTKTNIICIYEFHI